MSESLKKLRIFVASPSDVASERAKLATVVEMLKPMADYLGLMLEVLDWRAVVPDTGRPQQVIFDQLKPTSWDIFIGILWHRFGTPPGAKDKAGRDYFSGTEEEFKTAYEMWRQYNKPRVVLYRCTRGLPYDVDSDHLKRVRDFFKLVEDVKGDYRLLYQAFDTTDSFEKLLLDHLQKLLIEYSEQETKQMITIPTLDTITLTRTPNTLPRRTPFFGRKNEIIEAMRALSPEDRGWGLVIDGIGGIGKTALALEVAYLCKEQGKFDAFVFVSAKQDQLEPLGIHETTLAATTLDAFINEIARVIGQQGIRHLEIEQKSRVLIDSLRGLRALLILDNLETLTTSEQSAIGEFLRNLPMDCKAIITSRRRANEAAVTVRLEKLDWKTARELIENEIERHPDVKRVLTRAGEAGWKQLYDETGGSPLALTWTIGMIRARGFSFERALELLRNGSAESDLNAYIFRRAQEKMDENENVVLIALSFFDEPATFDGISAITNLGRHALDVVLERLRALSLVDITESESGEEQYSLHPLTRRFVHKNLAKDTESGRSMRASFSQYTLNRELAFAMRENGLVALQRKEYSDAEKLLKEALAHWQNLDNIEWIAIVLNDLGELAREQEDYDTAEQYLIEALRLSRRISNKLEEAIYIGNLGELAIARKQWDDARKWFEQELKIAQEIGDIKLIADAQYGLSRVFKVRGNVDLALPLAQEMLKVYERLQHKDLMEVRKFVERLSDAKGKIE